MATTKKRKAKDGDETNRPVDWIEGALFGEIPVDLSNKLFTTTEKRWLGLQLINKVLKDIELSRRFNIPIGQLSYYKRKVKKGGSIFRDSKEKQTYKLVCDAIATPLWWTQHRALPMGYRMGDDEKIFIVDKIDSKTITVNEFCQKFGVPETSVYGYKKQLKQKGYLVPA